MKTRYASLLLTSACAVGLCGAAWAQTTNAPPPALPPQQAQPAPQQQQTMPGPSPMDRAAPAAGNSMAASGTQGLPVDRPATVSGVQVMCGGIGKDESDPAYAPYPAKIEVAGGYGQWLGDNDITISGKGQNVAAHCRGPWFMAQLQPGSYNVSITHGSTTHTARLSVASGGQHKIVVRFPELDKGKDDGKGPYTGQTNGGNSE